MTAFLLTGAALAVCVRLYMFLGSLHDWVDDSRTRVEEAELEAWLAAMR